MTTATIQSQTSNAEPLAATTPAHTAEKVAPLPAPKPVPENASANAAADPLAQASPQALAAAAATAKAELARVAAQAASHNATHVKTLDAVKRGEFLVQVASTFRDYTKMGSTEADAVQSLLQMQEALTLALSPAGTVARAASAALNQALNAQIADPHCHIPLAESEKTIRGILTKREAEASAMLSLLSDKAFIEEACKLAASEAELKKPHWYNEEKKEEIISELTADSPAHTLGNGIGQHFLHKALASVYKLDGPLQAPLVQALKAAAPAAHNDSLISTARGWLHDRFHRADTLATDTKPGTGVLYIEAMKRAEAKIVPIVEAHTDSLISTAREVLYATKTKPAEAKIQPAPATGPATPAVVSKEQVQAADVVQNELARIAPLPAAQPETVAAAPAQHEGVVAQAPALQPASAPAV